MLICVSLYFCLSYGLKLNLEKSQTLNAYPSMIFDAIFPVLMGLLLEGPNFLTKMKIRGSWGIDWLKLVTLGIPTLVITTSHLLYFSPIGNFVYPILLPWNYNDQAAIISGVIFGYVLINSIKKVQERPRDIIADDYSINHSK
ncbi:hypothetical protein JCM15765_31500 [Paradesulfitobacterium aromaticivorans]